MYHDVTTNTLMNLRLPILVHICYKVYHKHFFSQFPIICLYGILGQILLIFLTSLINQALMTIVFEHNWTFSQIAMFSCLTSMVDPMTIFFLKPSKNFYLFLGIYLVGNATAWDLYSPTSRAFAWEEEWGNILTSISLF